MALGTALTLFATQATFAFTVETPATNSANATQFSDPDHKVDDKTKNGFGTSSNAESTSGFHVYGSTNGQSDNPANNEFTPRPNMWSSPNVYRGR